MISNCAFDRGDGIQRWWWDGPDRYQNVNRNVISQVQRDMFYQMIEIFVEGIGIEIGGGPYKFGNILCLNIKSPCDIIGRGEMLPIKNESINYILSSHTLEHVPNTEETLKEWLRIIKPGGYIGTIIPDKKFFLHDKSVTKDGEVARHEVSPEDMILILNRLPNIKILLFNTRQNNFDFEFLIKKEK